MVSTTLPMCRAWLRWRNASVARRTSQAVTGSGGERALPEQRDHLGEACRCIRCGVRLAAGRRRGTARRRRRDLGRRRGCPSCPSPRTGRRAQQPQRGVDELTGQGVEHHVHPASAGRARTPVEVQVAEDAIRSCGHAERPQRRPTWRGWPCRTPRRRGAGPAGRRPCPTPPAAAWISTDSPGRRPARSTRRVVGGEEDRGHGRGLGERPPVGYPREQSARRRPRPARSRPGRARSPGRRGRIR